MNKNSVDLSAAWQKVKLGFLSASIPQDGIRDLEVEFDSWDQSDAKSILEFGRFSESNNENRDSRNLFRALNFLTAVQVKSVAGIYGGIEKDIKAQFSAGGSGNSELIKRVKGVYDAIAAVRAAAAARPIVPVPVDQVRLTAQPQLRTNAPVSLTTRQFDDAAREVLKTKLIGAMQQVRTNIRSSNRELVAKSFDNNAAISTAWSEARRGIENAIDQNAHWLLFNYTTLNTAIMVAYRNFDDTVAKDSKKTGDRLKLISTVLDALSAAPPPLSVVGKVASKVVGIFRSDNYDPTSKYAPLKGDDKPLAVRLFAERLEQYENGTVLMDLSHLSKVAHDAAIATALSAATLTLMQDATKHVLDRIFGEDFVDSGNKLEAHKQAYLRKSGQIVRGQEKNQHLFMNAVIRGFASDVQKAIEAHYGWKKSVLDPNDLRIAIEMFLYSEYVIDVFHKQGNETRLYSDNMINFFAQKEKWGVLMLHQDTHEESTARRRLNWKGGDDHKRALVMFCGWYLKNINPFALITGTLRNGEPYSAELIVELCHAQIDLINRAISHGRTLTTFWGKTIKSSWDWDRIDYMYKSLCTSDVWDMAD